MQSGRYFLRFLWCLGVSYSPGNPARGLVNYPRLSGETLKGMNTLTKVATLSKIILPPVLSIRKEFAPNSSLIEKTLSYQGHGIEGDDQAVTHTVKFRY